MHWNRDWLDQFKSYITESYEGLEDADEFEDESDPIEIEWRSVYTTRIYGTGTRVGLLIDINNPRRWEVIVINDRSGYYASLENHDEFDLEDSVIDAKGRDYLTHLATWLGVKWSNRTSYENLLSSIKDQIYLKAYKDNTWNWPPQWGLLWDPPEGFPPCLLYTSPSPRDS